MLFLVYPTSSAYLPSSLISVARTHPTVRSHGLSKKERIALSLKIVLFFECPFRASVILLPSFCCRQIP